jgi:hypothetical protein
MNTSDDLYFTSKGPRHRSQILQVSGGTHVRRKGAGWQARGKDARTWRKLPIVAPPEAQADAQSGWSSWVDWESPMGPVHWFAATWTVPPPPAKSNGQTIYLFTGLQDAKRNHILQPVLQWGPAPAKGGGPGWSIASYWVGQERDPLFCSEACPVAAGTIVTGRMMIAPTLDDEGHDTGLFSCTCLFDNYPGTRLTAENLPPLVDCVITLESYRVASSAPYPLAPSCDFNTIRLELFDATPVVAWRPVGDAQVIVDGANLGEVELVYPSVHAAALAGGS